MSLANKTSYEDTNLSAEIELPFPHPVRKVVIINDGAGVLKWRLQPGETYSTLKNGELLQLEDVRVTSVWLMSSGTDYRVWGLG